MEQVRFGGTGLRVSRLCLGMMGFGDPGWRPWVLAEDESRAFVERAADAGITFFDTADVYSLGVSEELTGRLLRATFPRREDYVVATKVWGPMGEGPNDRGLSRSHILDGVDASLRRLGTDHIDLYQIHRFDPEVPPDETMEALDDCVRSGKVRYLGASSMHAWEFAKLQAVARLGGWTPFVSMQNNYNLLYREEEREMLPYCADAGIAVIPWSPLARGRLARPADQARDSSSGRGDALVIDATADVDRAILDAVGKVAEARGVDRAAVALAWVLAKPEITAPIIGVTKLPHLESAIAAAGLELTAEEIAMLEAPYQPKEWRIHA